MKAEDEKCQMKFLFKPGGLYTLANYHDWLDFYDFYPILGITNDTTPIFLTENEILAIYKMYKTSQSQPPILYYLGHKKAWLSTMPFSIDYLKVPLRSHLSSRGVKCYLHNLHKFIFYNKLVLISEHKVPNHQAYKMDKPFTAIVPYHPTPQ